MKKILRSAGMIIVLSLFLYNGAKSLVGFYYYFTTPKNAFVCRDMGCWNLGLAQPYYIKKSHKHIVLYCCPEHIKESVTEQASARMFESPSILSFLMVCIAGFTVYALLFKPKKLINVVLSKDS